MEIDESFKKQGKVPFKWEIKPGVPKHPQPQQQQQHKKSSTPPPQLKLRPPPSAAEPRLTSFQSVPRSRPGLAEAVAVGCFSASMAATTPRLHRMISVKKDKTSDDAETPRRWSVSSRKSVVLPFGDSPRASFYGSSSERLSFSRPLSDHSEWGGFKFF